jgi:general secretion pathway protein E
MNKKIGEYLLEENKLKKNDLDTVLDIQKGIYNKQKIGKILVDGKFVEESILNDALDKQRQKTFSRIGDFLVDKKYITPKQLELALQLQKKIPEHKKIGRILIEYNFIKQEKLIKALNEFDPQLLSEEGIATDVIPKKILYKLKIMPLGESTENFYIATLYEDLEKIKNIISNFVDKTIVFKSVKADKIIAFLNSLEFEAEKELVNCENDYEIKEYIIKKALSLGASDIHIEVTEEVMLVRFRIDGVMHISDIFNKKNAKALFAMLKSESNLDAAETLIPQDGSFTKYFQGRQIDFRLATIPNVYGEKITIRILDKEKNLFSLDSLGISEVASLRRLLKCQDGLIVISGPTGSGKTTTLYSSIMELNCIEKSIYTIEDPVEYRLPFINQVQINRKVKLDFAYALRSFLRHDPDIIIVGEVRDKETAEMATYASKTGHLVFVTLHAGDIKTAMTRMHDLGFDQNDLAYSLRGILVQRLVRKKCPLCDGKGCASCMNIGYKGRTIISEICRVNSKEEYDKLIKNDMKYTTMKQDALNKIEKNVTSKEEINKILGEI